MSRLGRWGLWIAVVSSLTLPQAAGACPFCSAVALTFSEEIAGNDVAVIAKMVQAPPKRQQGSTAHAFDSGPTAKAKFEIVEILKGEKGLGGTRTFETVYFGDSPVGTYFLVMGIEPPAVNWNTPVALTDRARDYLHKALKLPKDGPDRLAFFQDYLEDKEDMISRDAYDEFAKAPYAGVKELKSRIKHDELLTWIQNPKVTPSRRRLYLAMLGVCGDKRDIPLLEGMIKSDDRTQMAALDALVASYLTLKGPEGMPLIEDRFLKNPDAEYTDTYATIMALRFHGQEEKAIPHERLLEGLRYMLDRPALADLVIPDLARWGDWSAMERLVTLFKEADEDDSSWVRVPVIHYLRACPLPEAKARLEELAKLDPETMKRAETFSPFGVAAAPAAQAAQSPAQNQDSSAQNTAAAANAAPNNPPADDATDTSDKSADQSAPDSAQPEPQSATESIDPEPTAAKESEEASTTESNVTGQSAAVPDDSHLREAAAVSKRSGALKGFQGSQDALPDGASWKVLTGMVATGLLLAVAFVAILRGGQRVTIEPPTSS